MAGKTMKAAVVHEGGPPEVLQIEQVPIPVPEAGQALVKVKAFGVNRSEMFTRQGNSPGIKFPRILGIEAVGIVEDAPGGEFDKGTTVVTCMGGLGRDFDGGYAEFTRVPANQLQAIETNLPWETLGAMPEMLQTAYGSLFTALHLQQGERLLIRAGTSSVGLAAAGLAKSHGAFVASTSRRESAKQLLLDAGVDEVIIDDGDIANKVTDDKFDKVLELVGTVTLHDSLRCVKVGGIVCITGIVGGESDLKHTNPLELIPKGVMLTTYIGDNEDFHSTPLGDLVKLVEEGKMQVPVGQVLKLDDIVEAHKIMEANTAGGKIVVLT